MRCQQIVLNDGLTKEAIQEIIENYPPHDAATILRQVIILGDGITVLKNCATCRKSHDFGIEYACCDPFIHNAPIPKPHVEDGLRNNCEYWQLRT